MNSSIKKYLIGAVIVVAFAAYAIFNSNEGTTNSAILPLSPSSSNPSSSPSSITAANSGASATESAAASGTPPTGASTAASGTYKDGTYTGPVADAFYGKLQAVVVIQNGRLADVQFPTYPSESGHTLQLSETDLPILKQEAITAQSADVNVISGATQTSEAFQQSLAAALAQAK